MARYQGKITNYLIAATVVIYVLQLAFSGVPAPNKEMDIFTYYFAFTPNMALAHPWTFVTAIFLHDTGNLFHILLNMFALWMFGPLLEAKIGQKRYFELYFATGILGNIGFMLLSSNPAVPGLGASGAIYGLLGALAVLEPNLVVYMFFMVPMPLWMAAIAWTLFNLAGTVFDLAGGIGYSAHLAGIVAGAIYAYTLRKKTKSIYEEYGLEEYM